MKWVWSLADTGEHPYRGPSPAFVLSLVEGLPSEGMFTAMRRAESSDSDKWLQFYEWGRSEAVSADIFDAVFENARMTGMWGKKTPKPFPPYPGRPVMKKKEKATVRGLFNKMRQAGAPIHGG